MSEPAASKLTQLARLHAIYGWLALAVALALVAPVASAWRTIGDPNAFAGGREPIREFLASVLGGALIAVAALNAAINLYAARLLKRGKGWTALVMVCVLNCLHPPLGTVLGLMTLFTLERPDVKAALKPSG